MNSEHQLLHTLQYIPRISMNIELLRHYIREQSSC